MRTHLFVHENPHWGDPRVCRVALNGGSKSFAAASCFLPAQVRRSATALYAFCRMADDAVDLGPCDTTALDGLRCRLDLIYAGMPAADPCDREFSACVVRYRIPMSLPLALLDGFAWDAAKRRYASLSELSAYGVRVAGSVGLMMALVMGVTDESLLARACDLGVAMQMTNIARDVGEDARMGRLYLPLDWLRDVGIDPDEWLADPVFNPALGEVIGRLLRAADELYGRSDAAIAELPTRCRAGIRAARLLYAEIGHELMRRGFDSVTQRTVLSWHRKVPTLMSAFISSTAFESLERECDRMPEANYLLRSLKADGLARESKTNAQSSPRMGHRGIDDRAAWLVDLFYRLHQRDLDATRT